MFKRVVIVGNDDITHIGHHFFEAAKELNLRVEFCDVRNAFCGAFLKRQFNWRFRGRRPVRLREFSEEVTDVCEKFQPHVLLSTGIAPIDRHALKHIGAIGVVRVNYSTDDPWNPNHHAPWFIDTLAQYDGLFTTRRSNLEQLRRAGCRAVSYLPFAYSPEIHFVEKPSSAAEEEKFSSDVMFAGGGDQDRLAYITELIRSGFSLALYGGYWDRFAETRSKSMGHGDVSTVRKAVGGTKVSLCLVRRANRDGNCMRSFEVPACGGCMLTEDTLEHREIFGPEGKAVVYFRGIESMVEKCRWLLTHDDERERLAKAAYQLITTGGHTYKHRLSTMLDTIGYS